MAIPSGGLLVKEFVENFELLLEASGGTKRLRELTVELAARGCLPGFDPSSWRSVVLSDVVADFQNGTSKRRGDAGTPIPVLRLADIESGTRLRNENLRELLLTSAEQEKYRVRQGDVLVIRVNGSADLVGRFVPCNVSRLWAYSDHLIRLRLRPELIDAAYISTVARSASAREYLATKTVTTAGQKTVNQVGLGGMPLLLPPLAEQKRIVAKIDQLMGLIDELDAKQTKKREVQTRFRTSALDALTKADGPEELAQAWKRVAGNFGVLFELSGSVGDLRQLLLDLAVLGVLVRTGSADGDAPGFAAADVEPYRLPSGWRWSRLEALASHIVDCLHATPHYTESGLPAIRTADVVPGRLLLDRARLVDEEQFQDRIRRLEPAEGDIFYSREGERLGIAACVPPRIRVCLSQRMMHIRARAPMHPYFLMWVMNSRFVYRQAVHETGGSTSPHINIRDVRRFLIPVPPPEVQKRIVGKVETLMKLCDDLEARLTAKEATAGKLVEAVVKELVE